MFSGIVEKTGELKKIEKRQGKIYFTIRAGDFLRGVKTGDSIANDGVCLTVVKKAGGNFMVELMPETLRLTKFSQSEVGDMINLEKSLRLGDRISGHFVLGHVDAVGVVDKVNRRGADAGLTVKVPAKIMKYLAYKGSVSLNGASLTVSGRSKNRFKVSLISHTLNLTNLGKLKIGDKVNIEVDTVARYLENLIKK
ncbi:MAG: riboflavin synthase [bacterium]|nr:riboflavin synthase [bacterium]